jgi:anaerobic selenocysteine-containing dehydrogenase
VADLARLRHSLADADDGPHLRLIGRRDLRSNNSWMHNCRRLVRGRDRCTVMIHPHDAEARRVAQGQRVAVTSRAGRIELPAEVTDAVMPGVVSIPHGWGHDRPGVRLAVAREHAGASINDLTDELELDELTGNAALSGVAVTVEPIAG